ncbi:Gfo/Idh/MocA family oxidoreductase [Asanoa sp. WMMD1127]|uniref:Gfo/Idh/MocA family protein n=1 Tax=Asanoa sp. WMMD1127 TaxID=3016107 RepID=UPI002417314C|nr:Gfo/Idh/MocA family oxidoreductase [Asanoa sp. WMMD1127]MDG4825242.1 Gfo/Idh/MocA family oxidoreductase [Asanoa sp. WMMD1127]
MRFGIAGCGRIARNHVAALRDVAGVEVVAVADVDGGRARAFAERHGVPRAYDDVEAMLAAGLDAVTICTPHGAHEAGVLAAARHGVHVLCEKPVALRVEQADRMVAATAAAGVRFGVLFQRRFWPAAMRIRAAIDDGRLGRPICGAVVARLNRDAAYYAEPWRGRLATEGGGVLMTQAIHHVDLLLWYLGPARRVTGRCATLVHRGVIEVEDTAAAIVEFASGAIATIQAGTTFRPGLGVQVWVGDGSGHTLGLSEFPEGVGATDVSTLDGERVLDAGPATAAMADLPLGDIHDRLAPYHALQVRDFVAALREDREPAVTGLDAIRSLEVVEAIYRSSRTGEAVEVGRW